MTYFATVVLLTPECDWPVGNAQKPVTSFTDWLGGRKIHAKGAIFLGFIHRYSVIYLSVALLFLQLKSDTKTLLLPLHSCAASFVDVHGKPNFPVRLVAVTLSIVWLGPLLFTCERGFLVFFRAGPWQRQRPLRWLALWLIVVVHVRMRSWGNFAGSFAMDPKAVHVKLPACSLSQHLPWNMLRPWNPCWMGIVVKRQ